jgi:hypothetical protein
MAVRLSAFRAGRASPRMIPGTRLCLRLSRPCGHSAAGRIMYIENSNDLIGNRQQEANNIDECCFIDFYVIFIFKVMFLRERRYRNVCVMFVASSQYLKVLSGLFMYEFTTRCLLLLQYQ